MTLLVRINLWLSAAFFCCIAAAMTLSRAALREEAREDAVAEARLLMDAAQAARDYTTREVAPLLSLDDLTMLSSSSSRGQAGTDLPTTFHPQTIPAYAATQIFDALRRQRPEFSYREAMLNPTNPRDRAQEWEADVIKHFRSNENAVDLVRERTGELGRALYLAKPIRIDDARCLACHDTPNTAPAPVLRQYGSVNGFGWKLHETVGAQIVSVPLENAMSRVNHAMNLLIGAVAGSFLVMFVIVNLVVHRLVLKPIARLAAAAEGISTGAGLEVPLQVAGSDEIADLGRSFERMRASIAKSIALLGGTA